MKSFKEFLRKSDLILEMTKVISNKNPNYSIWIENPSGFNNKYFKLYNSTIIGKADKVAKISLKGPNYLNHKNNDGKKNWILNMDEKLDLMKILKSKTENPNFNIWQYMILKYNNDNFDINEKDLMENKISVNEYEKIIKNTEGSLSINLPLSDYTKL